MKAKLKQNVGAYGLSIVTAKAGEVFEVKNHSIYLNEKSDFYITESGMIFSKELLDFSTVNFPEYPEHGHTYVAHKEEFDSLPEHVQSRYVYEANKGLVFASKKEPLAI